MVGQRFITLLANHPWYEITARWQQARVLQEKHMRRQSADAGKCRPRCRSVCEEDAVMNVNEDREGSIRSLISCSVPWT